MPENDPQYLVLPDSERNRLALDRLRSVETQHFQLKVAQVAGDPVNEQELERLEQSMARLRKLINDSGGVPANA